MRGEDAKKREKAIKEEETPPHAWGRRVYSDHVAIIKRNTPTCVGKTFLAALVLYLLQKHPHMRGEDETTKWRDGKYPETPPHAWGRRWPLFRIQYETGNTPTCVGKTLNDH